MRNTKNRIFAAGAVLVMCLTAFAALDLVSEESDAAWVISGTLTGSTVNYVLDDQGVLTLSGSGDMPNLGTNKYPWDASGVDKSITSVIVGEGITSISNNAFNAETNIVSVTLPSTLKDIKGYAFANTPAIRHITLPEGLETIGSSAFYSSGIEEIVFPSTVRDISSAFRNCPNLAAVDMSRVPSDCSIGGEMFKNCYALASVDLGSITSIPYDMFRNDSALTSILIPGTVTSIQSNAFNGYTSLATVYNGSSLNITAGSTDNGYVAYYATSVIPVSYTHTVTYGAGGGTGSMPDTVVTDTVNGDTNIILAANGFTKSGYTFVGWLVNGSVLQPGQTVSVGADASITAVAQWSENTVSVSVNSLSGVSGLSYSNQIGASASNGGTLTYAVKSCTGGNATVNQNGLVTYAAPTVSSTSVFSVTVTVTGTFGDGSTVSEDVTFSVTVDPVLSFTNAATNGTLSVKGA